MTVVIDAAVQVLDAAIWRLRDARQRLDTLMVLAGSIEDDTAWRARAVADYRTQVRDWQAGLQQVAARLGDQEQELATMRAVLAAPP